MNTACRVLLHCRWPVKGCGTQRQRILTGEAGGVWRHASALTVTSTPATVVQALPVTTANAAREGKENWRSSSSWWPLVRGQEHERQQLKQGSHDLSARRTVLQGSQHPYQEQPRRRLQR